MLISNAKHRREYVDNSLVGDDQGCSQLSRGVPASPALMILLLLGLIRRRGA